MSGPHRTNTTCRFGGKVVSREGWIPDNPFDHHWGRDLPPVGCSQLRCSRCDCPVLSRLGVVRHTGARIDPGELYRAADWSQVAGVRRQPSANSRLYACPCTTRQISANEDLDPPFDGPGGRHPWGCGGHPHLESGDHWCGHVWDLDHNLAAQILPLLANVDAENSILAPYPDHALARLYHNVAPANRASVAAAVGEHLEAAAAATAAAAALFFDRQGLPTPDR